MVQGPQLDSFLLRTYIAEMRDTRRSTEEQLHRQMALEHLILTNGISALREVQGAFNVGDEQLARDFEVAQWFMTFASSLKSDLLREVKLSVIERFWRTMADRRLRQAAIGLIAKIVTVNDPSLNSAYGSSLVGLFRKLQPQPFSEPLQEDAQLIVLTLFRRVKLTRSSDFGL